MCKGSVSKGSGSKGSGSKGKTVCRTAATSLGTTVSPMVVAVSRVTIVGISATASSLMAAKGTTDNSGHTMQRMMRGSASASGRRPTGAEPARHGGPP